MKLFSFLNSSNFRQKMLVVSTSFVLVSLGVIAVALVSRYYAREGTQRAESLTARFVPSLITVSRLQEAALNLKAITYQFALARDEAAMNVQKEKFKTATQQAAVRLADLKKQAEEPESQALVATFATALKTYQDLAEKFQTELRGGDFEKAMATLDQQVAPAQQKIETQLHGLADYYAQQTQNAGTATAAALGRADQVGLTTSVGLVSLTLLGLTLSLVANRAIMRQMFHASEALVDAGTKNTSVATEITESAQALADGASSQAASLEETAASLEEVSSMTKRNAESAGQAKTLSGQVRVTADTGSARMKDMQTAMEAISVASKDITKILKTIDEIAFQTNILALNAAVEAARAGEAGAGFAVVAEEVRALAQRSALAAKETATKIEFSVAKSGEGALISTDVARHFEAIQRQIRQLDGLVAEVATASSEQSTGLAQLNHGVSAMEKVTQQNAATAEESAAAAAELRSHASAISEVVGGLLRNVGGKRRNDTQGLPGEPRPGGRRKSDPAPGQPVSLAKAGVRSERVPSVVG